MTTDTRSASDCKSESEGRSHSLLDKHELFHRIAGDRELKDSAVRVAAFLMWRLNCKREECWPGRQTIADALGMSLRTVGDALRSLKDRGWVSWRERRREDGTSTTSVFTFVWSRVETDNDSYVAVDKARPQDPDALTRAGKICQPAPAKSARRTLGREPREGSTEVLTASPSEPRPAPVEKPSPSAEKKPLQKGSREWWLDQVFTVQGQPFKASYYPGLSQKAFRERLGAILKRERWDFRKVDSAMRETVAAGPSGDAFEYMAGVLRQDGAKPVAPMDEFDRRRVIDYSQPAPDGSIM